jgi:hypothetical protein
MGNVITKYSLFTMLVIVQLTTALFGGHFGYTIHGAPSGAVLNSSAPGILGALGWVWDSIAFMFNMMTFQIDGMPAFISVIFIGMAILTAFIILNIIRGTD